MRKIVLKRDATRICAEHSAVQNSFAALWRELADNAFHVPDYRSLGVGDFFPTSRAAYRAHQFAPIIVRKSAARGERSRKTILAGVKTPEAFVAAFAREISANKIPARASLDAVQRALAAELLAPLRAINESVVMMAAGHRALKPRLQKVVNDITAHVLIGDFHRWRYDNPIGRKQQRSLTTRQKTAWQNDLRTDNGDLCTREEDDLELFWVTKVGGPSHGFDYNPACLLPLLANARTKAILLDDARYPLNAAARAYLRLLETPAGKPVLYLEPLQRDFPHREKFTDANVDVQFYAALIAHALQKAKTLGVSLSLPAWLAELTGGEMREEKYVVSASAGVFEASDTLSDQHHWPHLRSKTTAPLARVILKT